MLKGPVLDRTCDALRWIFDQRIHDPALPEVAVHFPNASRFVATWQAIRAEACAVTRDLGTLPRFHDLMPEQASISANDGRDWRLFILRAYGVSVGENRARCPVTSALLESCPEVLSASFSCLAPGKHIPPHRGPFRGILRFHLGLSMPLDEQGRLGAVLWVDGIPHRLADGDGLLWDDTFLHEVRNDTDQVRVALLLDVWRQGMPTDMVLLSHLVVSLVQTGIRRRGVRFAA